MNNILTINQVAEVLGVHTNTAYRYVKAGILKAHKLGGNGDSRRHWRVKECDLDHFREGLGQRNAEHTKEIKVEESRDRSLP